MVDATTLPSITTHEHHMAAINLIHKAIRINEFFTKIEIGELYFYFVYKYCSFCFNLLPDILHQRKNNLSPADFHWVSSKCLVRIIV